jgi:hypothetical protein
MSAKAVSYNKALDLMRAKGAVLVRMYIHGSPEGRAFYIVPGGYVEPDVAKKIMEHPQVIAVPMGFSPHTTRRGGWHVSRPRTRS